MSLTETLNAFFIHSSVDGYLGGFHVPAFVNSDAMNTGILSGALLQHHLLGFEIAQLEFHHLH